MLFAFICRDKPGHLQVRLDNRPAHVEFLDGLNAEGTLKFAGPFLDDDGKPCGTLIVVEAGNRHAARGIADADPYAKAGLFSSVDIQPWNWVFNNPANAS
jgi:uncharacterized protein YciI